MQKEFNKISPGVVPPSVSRIISLTHQQGFSLTYELNFRNYAKDWIFFTVIMSPLFHCNHPDGHDDVREAFLPLNSQDLQACLSNDGPHDVQMATDAAIYRVQFAALPRHIVLHYDDTIWTQTLFAAKQEVHQVLVCQVAWRKRWTRNNNQT